MSIEQRLHDTLVAEAERLAPVPDVEDLVRRGDQVRRRRWTSAGAIAVLVAALVATTTWAGQDRSAAPVAPIDGAFKVPLLTTVTVGESPEEVVADPVHGTVYVTESGADQVAVIDTTTESVVKTIDVGDQPMGLAIDPEAAYVYVANLAVGSGGSVSVIDTSKQSVAHTIPLGEGALPFDVAVDREAHTLFVTENGTNAVGVVDTRTWKVVDTIPMGAEPSHIAVDPEVGEAYVATGGTLTVIDTRSPQVLATLDHLPARAASGPVGMVATDPTAGRLLVANPGNGTVSVVDTRTHELVGTVGVGGSGPIGLQVDPGASTAYVTGAGEDGGMAVLDLDRLAVVGRVAPALNSIWVGQPAVVADAGTVYAPLGGLRIGVIPRQ